MPADSDSAIPPTLFDCQLPTYLALPAPPDGMGQFVITSGDVLLGFDPAEVRFDAAGLTGLGCRSDPQRASHHGVFCADADGQVRLYLQKPSEAAQADRGAIDRYGQAILDIGVMNFDAAFAAAMLKVFEVDCRAEGRLGWSGPLGGVIESAGLDFYREICCALGTETTAEYHAESVRAAGSRWGQADLRRLFDALKGTTFHAQVLPRCEFMHFGTTRQIIAGGLDYQRVASGVPRAEACLSIRNALDEGVALSGRRAWVEACEVRAPLTLGGDNVVVGLEVDEPTALPAGACVDVLPGQSRDGRQVWFVRCYGVDDTFKESAQGEATFNGRPLNAYLSAIDAGLEDVWGGPNIGDIWEARLFPAEADPHGWRR
jgi:fucokinase